MQKTKPQCGLIIENAEGKVLLQLRDNNPALPYPNCWGTFGGQVEDGETPEQAVKREIKEELGYDVENPDYLGNYPFDGYDIHMFRKVDRDMHLENIRVREGQQAQFFSAKDITEIQCAFNCRMIVKDYFKKFFKT